MANSPKGSHVCFRGIRVSDLITPIAGPMHIEPSMWANYLVHRIATRIESLAQIGLGFDVQCVNHPELLHEFIETELSQYEKILQDSGDSSDIELTNYLGNLKVE
jgi:hypothetical protein